LVDAKVRNCWGNSIGAHPQSALLFRLAHPAGGSQKKALASASSFFNEAHLRCMQNETGLRPMKRAFGTRRG